MEQIKFRNPPLIELVAECRWIPVDSKGNQVLDPSVVATSSADTEAFYDRFRMAVAKYGYLSTERVIPVGFAYPMHTPVFRYRQSSETATPTVLQVGVGLLSIHALPPYNNWDEFRPVIEAALSALGEAQATERRAEFGFSNLSLRYIDSFGPQFTRGLGIRPFASEVLGLEVKLPKSLSASLVSEQALEFGMQLRGATKNGLMLAMNIGRNPHMQDSVLMDVTISANRRVELEHEPLVLLDDAHNVIREIFVDMTRPIQDIMQPINEGML